MNRLVTSKDPCKWHLYRDPSDEYLAQVSSEHKVLIRNRTTGKAKEIWQKKKEAAANHFLDAEIYALSAADIIRALNMRMENMKTHQPEMKEDHSRRNWIRKPGGAWL